MRGYDVLRYYVDDRVELIRRRRAARTRDSRRTTPRPRRHPTGIDGPMLDLRIPRLVRTTGADVDDDVQDYVDGIFIMPPSGRTVNHKLQPLFPLGFAATAMPPRVANDITGR